MKEYKKAARVYLYKEEIPSRGEKCKEKILSILVHVFTLGLYWLVVLRPYHRDSERLGVSRPCTYRLFRRRYYRYRWRLNIGDGETLTAPGSIVSPRCVMLGKQPYVVNAWAFIRIQRLRRKTVREIKKKITRSKNKKR